MALKPATIIRLQPGPPRTVFPDVRCDLIWNGERWTLTGPQSRPRFGVVSQTGVLISLEPLAARQWLGAPLGELVDVAIPLREIRPASGRRPSALHPASPRDRRLEEAERWLRAGRSVREAAEAVQLSPRQLERWFAAELGLNPKAFARIVRFRRACNGLRRGASLAAAAADAGYVDQSHLARDCRKLGDITPAQLRSRVADVQDAVRGEFAS